MFSDRAKVGRQPAPRWDRNGTILALERNTFDQVPIKRGVDFVVENDRRSACDVGWSYCI
jgi:hypothetical protein